MSGEGESDICFDGNHLVLAGDHRYIQLHGLRGTPTRVLITSDTGGIWEFPPNAAGNWVVLPRYDGAGNADLWFEPWSSQRFHVTVWYSDGSTDESDAL